MTESPTPLSDSPSHRPGDRFAFGLTGFVLALLGLLLYFTTPFIIKIVDPRPRLDDAIADAGDKLLEKVVNRVKGKQPVERAKPPVPLEPYLKLTGNILGVLGAVLGTAAWVRREDHRLAGSAIAIGALAVAFDYIFVALFFILIIVSFLVIFSF